MSYQVVDSDPSKVTDINVGIDSPHVVTFRIWYRNPEDEKWTRIGEGQTADDSPDYFQTGPLGDETRLAYYLIIVGNAFTSFSATVTLSVSPKPGAR
jgi:hypothetical protein